ncbi:hypothetical protein BC941DRAFT_446481 [Chlamydoabsidia padenii]|nr:hypothetical protein BC941DRAFT_446481 [Chlamydoabsidia padenii]
MNLILLHKQLYHQCHYTLQQNKEASLPHYKDHHEQQYQQPSFGNGGSQYRNQVPCQQIQSYNYPTPHSQTSTHELKASITHRLSDEDEDHYTDAQLKMMTSKERRQLRNKISARNFRNRRKEYIASLEEQVTKFKNENCQLLLEIKWIRSTMNKLQTENDQLRVKLALCHNGIKTDQQDILPTSLPSSPIDPSSPTPIVATSSIDRSLSPPSQLPGASVPSTLQLPRRLLPTATPYPPSMVHPPQFNNSSLPPTTDSINNLSSSSSFTPPAHHPWDHVSPSNFTSSAPFDSQQHSTEHQQQSTNPATPFPQQHDHQPSSHNSYIETAVFPDLNLANALSSKRQQQTTSNNLFFDYPLLVVALMSIVISHTLSMTTNDLLSHTVPRNDPSKKQVQVMWNNLLDEMGKNQLDNQEQQESTTTTTITKETDVWYDAPVTGIMAICPLYWMQRMLCRFIITYVVVKYPNLEGPCKTYLPICEKFRRRVTRT